MPETHIETLQLNADARDLADAYVAAGVLSAMQTDAQHIAMATVARVSVLVSWNFRHNLERIHGYNSVNLRKGYPMIEIRTPREVLSHG